MPAIKESLLVGTDWLRHIIMQIAVANMAKADNTRTGNHFERRCIGFVDEGRD
ncbi:hypothetical protein D3C87_1964730 [compost metagenome]